VISLERIRETRAAAARVHPRNNPSAEDLVAFHLLHARHEEEDGRPATAAMAKLRATRILQRAGIRTR
jgi:hypothetical protein